MKMILNNPQDEQLLKEVRAALEPFKNRIKAIRLNENTLVLDEAAKYLQVKKAELVPDQFGKHIKINMIGLYDSTGKWQRWINLNEATIDKLKTTKIRL
jgi:hypothetical protein